MLRLIRPSCCLFFGTTLARSSTTSELVSQAHACCRSHRLEPSPQIRKQIEVHAWKLLNQDHPRKSHALSLVEAVELMHTWRYFSRWWERDYEGPSEDLLAATIDLDVVAPIVDKHMFRRRSPSRLGGEDRREQPAPPRASPLDEVLE